MVLVEKKCGYRFPGGSGSRVIMPKYSGDLLQQIDNPAGESPFVIVPAEHLHRVPHRHRQLRIEDAGVRVADDVGGDDALLRCIP